MDNQGASSSTNRPRRTCIGCRRRSQQRWLVRFAVAGGAIVVDADQRLPGRGAYLCWRTECATRVLTDGRRLAHALRTTRDRVTVDSAALLQDWEASRRDDGVGTATGQQTLMAHGPTTHAADRLRRTDERSRGGERCAVDDVEHGASRCVGDGT